MRKAVLGKFVLVLLAALCINSVIFYISASHLLMQTTAQSLIYTLRSIDNLLDYDQSDQELLRQTDTGGSTLLSPVSVVYALAMTANGAAGETLTQMESVLGLPLEELNACLRAYADQLPAEEVGRCSLANSIAEAMI